MIPRFVRSVLVGVAALAIAAGSANAFTPAPGVAAVEHARSAHAPMMPVHDRWNGGHGGRFHAPPVVVVSPRQHVRDGLCVTRQPLTSISCYRLLREQQQQRFFLQNAHEHGAGCGHVPRYAHRHGALVFLGWF